MLIRVTVKTADQKIAMIKLVRTLTMMGLREAKDFVELNMANVGDTFLARVENPQKTFKTLTEFTLWGGTPQEWANLITITVESDLKVALIIN